MSGGTLAEPTLESVESLLRDGLAHGDAVLSTAAPVLRHLLVHYDNALFSDEVLARTRAYLADMACQLLDALAEKARIGEPAPFVADRRDVVAMALADEPDLLAHLHALAVEGALALQLQARSEIDPVLCPLLQDLVASRDDAVAGVAMAVLAAQARFVLHHRQMTLPLIELPGELLSRALLVLQAKAGRHEDAAVAVGRGLGGQFDANHGRLGLIAQLIAKIGAERQGLDVCRAGVGIFATALATASAQDRDLCILSLSDGRFVRLALALRAAGLSQAEIEKQLLHLDADIALPNGFAALGRDRAALLLAAASQGE